MNYANLRVARVLNMEPTPEALRRVVAYLPSNYQAEAKGSSIVIYGEDRMGWTMDDYVIPRLASGMIVAKEVED